MSDLKVILKENAITKDLYSLLKRKKADNQIKRNTTDKNLVFENRSQGKEKLIIIIAGYKDFLWDSIFERLSKFSQDDCDICIASSGKYVDELSKIAEKKDWSYLSIKRNNVCLVQNIVIDKFSKAQWIYKIDEDIFITENTFDSLLDTYEFVSKNEKYSVGFVAPLIPINGYGHVRILEKLNLVDYYEEHFEEVKYVAGPTRMIENNPKVAKFMWGENGFVPSIDELSSTFKSSAFDYSVCPIRFSIGCILFKRSTWKKMGMFHVERTGAGMGLDEVQLCSYCTTDSKVMIVDENTVVGHLSFGTQNVPMKDYYLNHKDTKYFNYRKQESK